MDYLADTVAVVRHLRQHPALGRQAARILHDADQGLHRIYISAITLMEVLYLSEAGRIDLPLDELVAPYPAAATTELSRWTPTSSCPRLGLTMCPSCTTVSSSPQLVTWAFLFSPAIGLLPLLNTFKPSGDPHHVTHLVPQR